MMMQVTNKLKKENYDRKTKLEQMLDYYDCPVCLEMKEDLLECPSCTSRSCPQCLNDFSRAEHAKNPNAKAQGIYKCTICPKVLVHKPMHKFLK